jgi:nucleoside-diphosphate-sugar epimerase
VETVAEIIGLMRAAVPAGQQRLDEAARQALGELTQGLIQAKENDFSEYDRFLGIAQRGLCLPDQQMAGWLEGVDVVVTGGTGCVGSSLIRQLATWRPRRVVSVSRSLRAGSGGQPGVEYRTADVRDRAAMNQIMADIRPSVVFHLAAQRDPSLAEVEVHRTVSTNILGTRNVLAAAADAGVPQVVCASTGKALRPYSPDVYTASKRAAEWVAADVTTTRGLRCAAARFTHVLDNSIIHRRLQRWAGAASAGEVIRLHSANIAFYVQSALESVQLLLVAGCQAGEFRINAIADLGWPFSLLDLALGVLARTGSATPIYISGYDPGYEEVPFPGLYDPATAGDVSPLLNAFEAAVACPAACAMVNAFPAATAPAAGASALLGALEETCARTQEPGPVRAALDDLSWALLDRTLQTAPQHALARAAALADPHQFTLCPDHQRILDAIRMTTAIPSVPV